MQYNKTENTCKTNTIERDDAYALLPFQFIEDIYKIILSFDPNFLTPNDLPFLITDEIKDKNLVQNIYNREYIFWMNYASKLKIHYIILHDCDSAPDKSIRMLDYEASLSMKSTFSLYVTYFINGIETKFPINYEKLLELQTHGFCMTYHWNQVVSENFIPERYWELFDRDINFLRAKGFDITFYSSHGGRPSKEGKYNYEFYCPEKAVNTPLSTHNKYRIIGCNYSDGGITYRPHNSDIRNFLANLNYGMRHNILLHPCWYGAKDDTYAQNFFATHQYIKEYWDYYHAGDTSPYWKNVIKSLASKKMSAHR